MMIRKGITALSVLTFCTSLLFAQTEPDTVPEFSKADSADYMLQLAPVSTGWSDEAVAIGYVAAPSVVGLMFISTLVSEWNAGYFGIPASAVILSVPALIYLGGRSVTLSPEIFRSRANLGWTLYGLSILPTTLALVGFTTDWGATLPLTIASGILGTASIIAMTTYAFGRSNVARGTDTSPESSLYIGLIPVRGGAMASLTYRF